jgi:hypothetical protein
MSKNRWVFMLLIFQSILLSCEVDEDIDLYEEYYKDYSRSLLEHVFNRPVETSRDTYFTIPQKNGHLICTIKDFDIECIDTVKISYDAKSVVVDNRYIAAIDTSVKIFDFSGHLLYENNGNINPVSIRARNSSVFVGGAYERSLGKRYPFGELFATIEFTKGKFIYKHHRVPIEKREGKSIDDILIYGNKLLLLDNVVYPKYLILYDMDSKDKLEFDTTLSMPVHTIYEHVEKGSIGNGYLGTFSGSFGDGYFLSVCGKKTKLISNYWKTDQGEELKCYVFEDIEIIGDYLFTISRGRVYYLNLTCDDYTNRLRKLRHRIEHPEKLSKTPDGRLIISNENDFEWVVLRLR